MSDQSKLAAIQVRVTNNNTFELKDRFDGVPFRMPSGKTINLPLDAALHFFAFAFDPESQQYDMVPNFEHVCKRYGWNTAKFVLEGDDRKFFENLIIKPVRMEMVERPLEADELPSPRASADDGDDTPRAGRRRLTPLREGAEETA